MTELPEDFPPMRREREYYTKLTGNFMKSQVRVYCPECKGGVNSIWDGTLIEWAVQTSIVEPPPWANYAWRHQSHHKHVIMVKYPNRTVPLISLSP